MASSQTASHPTGIPATARCPRGIGLLFLDLDGTIIQAGEVSKRVRQALRRAHEMGCILVVSSGRPFGMMPHHLRRIGVDYYLCANGAKVYDASGTTLLSLTIRRNDVLRIMAAVNPLGPGWNVFSDSQCYIERSGMSYMVSGVGDLRKKIRAYIPRSRKALKVIFTTIKNHFFGEQGKHIVSSVEPIVAEHEEFEKVGCSFQTAEACDEAMRRIEELGGFEVARVWARELEITAAGVTKGTTADWLLDYLGVDRECTVAFGDSMNDAPLIGHVGRFVAMGNGSDEVKAIADEVCGMLAGDGVAVWLEEQMDEVQGRA